MKVERALAIHPKVLVFPLLGARWPLFLAALLTALFAAGCDNAAPRGSSQFQPPESNEPTRPDPGSIDDGVPYGTRLRRLTHAEYERTLVDLVGTGEGMSSDFLEDPTFAGFDNNAEALRVSGRLGRDYRRAAEELAERVTSSDELMYGVVPCDQATAACASELVESVGLEAFRRPLTETEVGRYVALFDVGPSVFGSGDDFRDGARLVLEAMLQSPNFLYRTELGTNEDRDGFIPLSDYEIASRLSYMMVGSMPDQELFELAKSGELGKPEVIEAQARRLAASDGVRSRVLDFHEQWLDLKTYANLSKDGELFPGFDDDLSFDYAEEVRRFVDYVVLEQDKGLGTLLTASVSFVNQRTAPFYGLDAEDFGEDLELIELPSDQRAGLLTQLGFLSAHAYTNDTSPIHRGVFVLRRVLCEEIPDPPGGIDLTLPETNDEIVTTRDQVEAHTSGSVCSRCHSMINPIGFAFEGFDAVGAYRETDNGVPVDTAASVELSGGSLSFDGALDLIRQIAETEMARACYAKQWLRYAYARADAPADERILASVAENLEDDDYSVRQLLVDLTRPRAFTHRAPTERD